MNEQIKFEQDTQIEFIEFVSGYDQPDKMISSEDAIEKEKDKQGRPRVMTKVLPTFDKIASGFEPGELIVVSGGTSQGKTLLLLTLLNALSEQGYMTALFEYELTHKQILERFSWEPPFFWTPNEIANFREPPINGLKRCSWYLPNKLQAPETKWVWLKAWELKCRKEEPAILDAIFVDHLHFMVTSRGSNISWDIGKATRDLKKLALDLDVMMFLAVHSTKKVVGGGELELEDMWGSSFISQDADTVLGVWNSEDYPKKFTMKLMKHRFKHGTNPKYFNLIREKDFLYEESRFEEEPDDYWTPD